MIGYKTDKKLENPFDNFLYSICDKISPSLVEQGITPNIVTTFSLISGLISVYSIYKNNYIIGSIFCFISYFFDCLDGYIARKFNMKSKFGYYYDHISDIITIILFFIVFFTKKTLNVKFRVYIFIIFVLIYFLGTIHIGCQELQKEDNNNINLHTGLVKLCRNKDDIRFTRFFGLGTHAIIVVLVIAFTPQLNNLFNKKDIIPDIIPDVIPDVIPEISE